jgi:hypothetical protein
MFSRPWDESLKGAANDFLLVKDYVHA